MVILFVQDFMFYWSHRTLHLPFLYKRVHKVHHEFYNTIAFASLYAHWFEWLFGNLMPVFINLFIFQDKLHVATFGLFNFYGVLKTHNAHSGYSFPYNPFESFIFKSNIKSWFKVPQLPSWKEHGKLQWFPIYLGFNIFNKQGLCRV